MSRRGMDPAAVEQIGRELRAEADRVDQALREIQSLVDRATSAWSGKDSDAFSQLWSTSHQPGLRRAAQMMRDMAGAAATNAQEQRRVSGR